MSTKNLTPAQTKLLEGLRSGTVFASRKNFGDFGIRFSNAKGHKVEGFSKATLFALVEKGLVRKNRYSGVGGVFYRFEIVVSA